MKVKKLLFGLVIFFMCFISVNAKNRIYNIDMNIYIDKDGKISMSTEENSDMNNKYVVLLAKFPLNTFYTNNISDNFFTFNDVLEIAEEGTFDYNYDDYSYKNSFSYDFYIIFIIVISVLIIFFVIVFYVVLFKDIFTSGYGYKDNKIIDKKNTPFFRGIPCNKDIYYANALIKLNKFGNKKSNVLGAMLLKWVKEDKIGFNTSKVGIFNKEESVIDLTKKPTFDFENEEKLYNIMYEASKDGYLEINEFRTWARDNYTSFLGVYNQIEYDKTKELENNGEIRERTNRKECKQKYVLSDKIYNDSKELLGLKLYLENFSSIDTKEVMEVKLWDEYLMFAYLFGIADKVKRQLKKIYPDGLSEIGFDYDIVKLIDLTSKGSLRFARSERRFKRYLKVLNSSVRDSARGYSSGGGGYSSGGGGRGSSGSGGGGGSR